MTAPIAQQTLLSVWKRYIQAAKECGEVFEGEGIGADIQNLHSINAHAELIEAAKFMPCFNEIYWAPPKEYRNPIIDCFANSLIIGDDGAGNYMVWMDVTDPRSKIIYACHDPAVIMVIANSAIEWLEGLIQGFKSPTFEEKGESGFGNYFENTGLETAMYKSWDDHFYNGKNDQLGLVKSKHGDLSYFDFNKAQRGAGVGLRFNGKHTALETGKQTGVVILGILSNAEVNTQRRRDIVSYGFAFAIFCGFFYYFYAVQFRGLIRSFFSSLIFLFLSGFIIAPIYIWLEGIRDKMRND